MKNAARLVKKKWLGIDVNGILARNKVPISTQ